jgi:hypothetical protein
MLDFAIHVNGDINDSLSSIGIGRLFFAGSPVAQAVDLDPVYRYLVAVTRLLKYMATILSENVKLN